MKNLIFILILCSLLGCLVGCGGDAETTYSYSSDWVVANTGLDPLPERLSINIPNKTVFVGERFPVGIEIRDGSGAPLKGVKFVLSNNSKGSFSDSDSTLEDETNELGCFATTFVAVETGDLEIYLTALGVTKVERIKVIDNPDSKNPTIEVSCSKDLNNIYTDEQVLFTVAYKNHSTGNDLTDKKVFVNASGRYLKLEDSDTETNSIVGNLDSVGFFFFYFKAGYDEEPVEISITIEDKSTTVNAVIVNSNI